MCFIQIFLNPRLVNLIGTAVFGKGVHITSHLFKLFQVLRVVVNEDVLVIDMVTESSTPTGEAKDNLQSLRSVDNFS